MKKKIFLLVFLILVCCGCTADYTLKINEDLSVEESIIALEGAEFFNQYEQSSVQRVIAFMIEPHLEYLNGNGYSVSQRLGDSEAGVRIEKKHKNLAEFKTTSKFTEQLASDWEYIETDDYITLKIKGEFNASEQDQSGKYLINSGTIRIILPFEVTSHNADTVSENVYTWNIEEPGIEKEISITFNKKIKKEISVVYFVIGGIIVILVIGVLVVYGKVIEGKKRNEF
jgi:hypothetical protein